MYDNGHKHKYARPQYSLTAKTGPLHPTRVTRDHIPNDDRTTRNNVGQRPSPNTHKSSHLIPRLMDIYIPAAHSLPPTSRQPRLPATDSPFPKEKLSNNDLRRTQSQEKAGTWQKKREMENFTPNTGDHPHEEYTRNGRTGAARRQTRYQTGHKNVRPW